MQTAALSSRFSAVKLYVTEAPPTQAKHITAIGVTTDVHDKRERLKRDGVYTVIGENKPVKQERDPFGSIFTKGILESYFNVREPLTAQLPPADFILSTLPSSSSDEPANLIGNPLHALASVSYGLRLLVISFYGKEDLEALRQYLPKKDELNAAITAKKITLDPEGGEIKFDLKA